MVGCKYGRIDINKHFTIFMNNEECVGLQDLSKEHNVLSPLKTVLIIKGCCFHHAIRGLIVLSPPLRVFFENPLFSRDQLLYTGSLAISVL